MKITNKSKIDLACALWLVQDDYDYNSDPYTISATTLLNPIKPIIMGAQRAVQVSSDAQEHSIDVVDIMGSRIGSALHDSLESTWRNPAKVRQGMALLGYPDDVLERVVINPSDALLEEDPDMLAVYIENRSHKKLGKWTISGKYDLIIDGQVEDYKSGSVYGYIFDSNRVQYIWQESIYRWLNPDKITNNKGKIHYIFTDWSKSKSKQDKKYPQTRIITKEYTLKSIEETEAFIQNKLNLLEQHITSNQDQLPSCTPTELWQKDSVWKYYKNPQNKARSTANFKNDGEAYSRWQDDGEIGEVVHHPGEVVRCKYCQSCPTCNQAKGYIQSGLLTLD